MDIFEQLDAAHIVVVNGLLTTNFGYNADDEPEDWCLSVAGDSRYGDGSFEYYFTWDDLENATPLDDTFVIELTEFIPPKHITIQFCLLTPVDKG